MKLHQLNTDEQVLRELGRRLKTRRIRSRLNQEELADRALIARTTLSKIENGHITQTPELIRLLRELGYMEALDQAIADESESPLATANTDRGKRAKGHTPKRVRARRSDKERPAAGRVVWPEDKGA